ncbi:hypothetical protein Rsub_10495 [Raphidocelis subcapitata]|uniref:C3H1-type domain-containing protein n=1 Tax=Raphidocelis subcapitata TaxID=307507 RepID=A0A2V0PKM7_9CHLO|nr:hypothetical protein Rsub_10495 [Raphidocelis subcapitata]|eukprot:GBF98430.1 hypothetical protein Rsub_10495 [Raphidocelis subcapitata]
MKGPGAKSPLDAEALVAQLEEVPPPPAAIASARDLLRSFFQWRSPGAGSAARRTLLHVAAHYGLARALRVLLDLGADPNAAGDDGSTPMHVACHARGDALAEVLEALLARGADKELRDALGRRPVDLLLSQTRSSELDKPEFCCDDFRMYGFKVLPCSNEEPHDWTECPFAHSGEKARRRDPRVFKYTGVACPDFRKGVCKRGDECTYGHGVFECWLHPSRYRTQLCKDGTDCNRRVCFFAHTSSQLREREGGAEGEEGGVEGEERADDAASDASGTAEPRLGLSRSSSCSDSGAAAPPSGSSDAQSPAVAAAAAAVAVAAAAPKAQATPCAAPASGAAAVAAASKRRAASAAAAALAPRRSCTPGGSEGSAPSSACGTPTRAGAGAAAAPAATSGAPPLLPRAPGQQHPARARSLSCSASLIAAYASSGAASVGSLAGLLAGGAGARSPPLPPPFGYDSLPVPFDPAASAAAAAAAPRAGSCGAATPLRAPLGAGAAAAAHAYHRRLGGGGGSPWSSFSACEPLAGSCGPGSCGSGGGGSFLLGLQQQQQQTACGDAAAALLGSGGLLCGLDLSALSLGADAAAAAAAAAAAPLLRHGSAGAASASPPLPGLPQADAAAAAWLQQQQAQAQLVAVQRAAAAAAASWGQALCPDLTPLALAHLQQEAAAAAATAAAAAVQQQQQQQQQHYGLHVQRQQQQQLDLLTSGSGGLPLGLF